MTWFVLIMLCWFGVLTRGSGAQEMPLPQRLMPVAVTTSAGASWVVRVTEDRLPESRWERVGEWQILDFGQGYTLTQVQLTWTIPSGHTARYRLEVSQDGQTWMALTRGTQEATTLAPIEELLVLPPTVARYVRVIGLWVQLPQVHSLAQVQVWGVPVPRTDRGL